MANSRHENIAAQSPAATPSKARALRSTAGRVRRQITVATAEVAAACRNSHGQPATARIAEVAVGPAVIETPTMVA